MTTTAKNPSDMFKMSIKPKGNWKLGRFAMHGGQICGKHSAMGTAAGADGSQASYVSADKGVKVLLPRSRFPGCSLDAFSCNKPYLFLAQSPLALASGTEG